MFLIKKSTTKSNIKVQDSFHNFLTKLQNSKYAQLQKLLKFFDKENPVLSCKVVILYWHDNSKQIISM